MADIAGDSTHAGNMEHPMAPMMYAISTFHCMTVSLALGGEGLGTMWGEQKACELLAEAGFKDVEHRARRRRHHERLLRLQEVGDNNYDYDQHSAGRGDSADRRGPSDRDGDNGIAGDPCQDGYSDGTRISQLLSEGRRDLRRRVVQAALRTSPTTSWRALR